LQTGGYTQAIMAHLACCALDEEQSVAAIANVARSLET
jgi:hypothetical protein